MKHTIIFLAGGLGTRLGDLTKETQKCMLPIAGKPMLWWLVQHYRKQGFTDFIINTGYLAWQVEAYDFGPGVRFLRDTLDHKGWARINKWDIDTYVFPGSPGWVLNGDTWIEEPLPEVTGPTIVTDARAIDAGAQFPGLGKIQVHKVDFFIDIGTPDGYDRLQRYAFYHGWHYDLNENPLQDKPSGGRD